MPPCKTGMQQLRESWSAAVIVALVQVRQRLKLLAAGGDDDPKLHELQAVLLKHFAGMKAEGKTTRAMVFTSLKDGAEHICSALNAMEGNIVIARHAHQPRPCCRIT